jgi:NADH:ubiquinone oxidoreductase subunit 5 (subunit L)/multisubunit Na+/H+ antiporter MnhA subunit
MEGPTPVSSLLHASTMIVSGAFLLQRFQFYIIHSFYGMCYNNQSLERLTALFAGTSRLITMDLKKIIAYSTCSQMGYLVFCSGIAKFDIAFFHLNKSCFF